MVEGRYYITQDLMTMFRWSKSTLNRKIERGAIPAPDIVGRPNKWLKHKIDAIINSPLQSDDVAG